MIEQMRRNPPPDETRFHFSDERKHQGIAPARGPVEACGFGFGPGFLTVDGVELFSQQARRCETGSAPDELDGVDCVVIGG